MKLSNLKTIMVFFFSLIAVTPCFASDSEELTKILNRLIDDKQGVGIAAAIIDHDKVQYLNFGVVDKTANIQTTQQHLFEIGSVSKTFTTLALASMVKEGKVKLDDAVESYLPKSVKLPKFSDKAITFLSLANHTSGLPRLPENMKMSDPLNPYADYTSADLYQFLSSYQLTREVGEKSEYSNLGMGLLGDVLSLIDHKSYEQMITDRVIRPLRMSNTFITIPKDKQKLFSNGHNGELKVTKHWDIPAMPGAGAIRSNLQDMVTYVKANMTATAQSHYAMTHQATANFGDNKHTIGLAWITNRVADQSYTWHNGGTGGFRSFIGFNRDKQKAIVLLSNSIYSMDEVGDAYLTGNLRELWTSMNSELLLSPTELDNLVGQYPLMPGFILTVTHDNKRLYIQATGQSKLPVYAKSNKRFFYKVVPAEVEFVLDNNGNATALTLFQGGQKLKGEKR